MRATPTRPDAACACVGGSALTRPFYDDDDPPFRRRRVAGSGWGLLAPQVYGREVGVVPVPAGTPRPSCAGTDPEIFFPEAGHGNGTDSNSAAARRVCKSCPLRHPCREEAIANHEYRHLG